MVVVENRCAPLVCRAFYSPLSAHLQGLLNVKPGRRGRVLASVDAVW
jgi:hypothetical protein